VQKNAKTVQIAQAAKEILSGIAVAGKFKLGLRKPAHHFSIKENHLSGNAVRMKFSKPKLITKS